MPDVTIIGNGRCPTCGGKTEIKCTEWFLFPDDQQTTEVETCQSCGLVVEESFSSTNATTAFEHSAHKEIEKRKRYE